MSIAISGSLLLSLSIVLVLLILKASVLAAATASRRGNLKMFINEEDATWLAGAYVEVDDARVQRVFRAHRNDVENLVLFVPAALLYLFSGAGPLIGAIYYATFALARFAHTYAYLNRKARLRRDAFTLGWLVNIVMSIHALIVIAVHSLR